MMKSTESTEAGGATPLRESRVMDPLETTFELWDPSFEFTRGSHVPPARRLAMRFFGVVLSGLAVAAITASVLIACGPLS